MILHAAQRPNSPPAARPEALDAASLASVDDAAGTFDLIVVGGGIQGLMVALEAGRRGLRPLLVERDRIGAATTRSWFRILHGGLRYLQHLDLQRLRTSMRERRFFLSNFPDLVEPMAFLMPLHGGGLRRPAAFRAAFAAEAVLTADRNRGVTPACMIPRGRVVGPREARSMYDDVNMDGLLGGAVWLDGLARNDTRLISEIAAWARSVGAVIHEGWEAIELLVEKGRVVGLRARPCGAIDDAAYWRAPAVVNAAGPWGASLASRLDPGAPRLFAPLIAFNVLLDRPPPAEVGLALTPRSATAPAIFLYPLDGMTFAGTWYCAPSGDPDHARPSQEDIDAFLSVINEVAPGLNVRREDVVEVFAGMQARSDQGALEVSRRDVIHDHGASGGPAGLFSVAGVKFTTARHLAERVLEKVCQNAGSPLPAIAPGTARRPPPLHPGGSP